MYLEVFKGTDRQWYVHLKNKGNHRVLLTSEGYPSYRNAGRAALKLQERINGGEFVILKVRVPGSLRDY